MASEGETYVPLALLLCNFCQNSRIKDQVFCVFFVPIQSRYSLMLLALHLCVLDIAVVGVDLSVDIAVSQSGELWLRHF